MRTRLNATTRQPLRKNALYPLRITVLESPSFNLKSRIKRHLTQGPDKLFVFIRSPLPFIPASAAHNPRAPNLIHPYSLDKN
uniref:Uncharacterized protein n=1 Tax=Leersia perrieri TaxID=77586 RepID=A0A0D9X285_9ORYZ